MINISYPDNLYNENVKKIIELLNEITKSEDFKSKMANMKTEFEEFEPVYIKTRVKSPFSMARKYTEIGCQRVIDVKDLYGFMIVTNNDKKIDDIAEYINEKYGLSIRRLKDYRKINPQNGYKSYHVNLGIKTAEIVEEILIEIQIKTKSMAIAQEATHDNVYKRRDIDFKERKDLVASMFPLFERIAYLQEIEDGEIEDEKEKVCKEIEEIYSRNSQIYKRNPALMKIAWKDYAIATFVHKNERKISANNYLYLGTHYSTITKIEAGRVFEFLTKQEEEIEGSQTEDEKMQKVVKRMIYLNYKDFIEILSQIQGKFLIPEATITGAWDGIRQEDIELIKRLKQNIQNLTIGVYSDDLIKIVYGNSAKLSLEERMKSLLELQDISLIALIHTLNLKLYPINGSTEETRTLKGNIEENRSKNFNNMNTLEIII